MVRMARSNSRRFLSPVSASVEASAASSIAAEWNAVSARTRSTNRPRWLQIAGIAASAALFNSTVDSRKTTRTPTRPSLPLMGKVMAL